jgi:NAD-dependent dihydropyrimidine dehydrogenase PreA subunit
MRNRYLSNVTTLALDREKCTGCRMCTKVCPQEVWRIDNKRARIADLDACMECSACQMNCEAGAITVRRGVGCASALINSSLGLSQNEPCC